MAVYTKKDFAKLCGIKTKDLANYIKRGKVVLNGEEIDGEVPENKYFVEKRQAFNAKKNNVELPAEEKKLNERTGEKKTKEVQPKFEFPAEHAPSQSENYQIDTKIKKQELEKSSLQTSLLKEKLKKISGDSIPTDLVKNLIASHSKSITIAFQNGADNLLMKIAKKKGLDRTEMAELRVDLIEIINIAVNDSIEVSKKTVRNIVAEYSQKKEQGERE